MNTLPSISKHIDEKIINKVIQNNFAALAPNYFTLTSNWFVRAYNHWKDILIKSTNPKSILLVGMPGSGKSYIGERLAKKLGWSHVDTDSLIERFYEKKLHEIIKDKGIDNFMNIEEQTLLDIKDSSVVISPGGSIIYHKKALEYFKNKALIIHLDTDFKILQKRINDPVKRGIIFSENQTLKDILISRAPLYHKHSHLTVRITKDKCMKAIDKIYKYI